VKAGSPPPTTVELHGPPVDSEPDGSPKKSLKQILIEPIPGLLLAIAISAAAIRLADVPYVKDHLHLGAMLLVILLGMLWKNVLPPPKWALPGIAVAQKPILRWGVALLGFKLSIGELISIGAPALAVVVIGTCAALAFGWWFGRAMGLNERLAPVLAVGGAVCGASAILAAETTVKAEQQDVAASIGVITLYGTLGIVLYPILGRGLHMAPFLYGVWTGASLHETAQVVAAGASLHVEKIATVVKLARIAMLAPIVFYLAWWMRKNGGEARAKVPLLPWFLVLFLAFTLINSSTAFGLAQPLLSKDAVGHINDANVWILAIGMAGVGLQTGFKDLRKAGWMSILVGGAQWLFLSLVAFTLATVLCGKQALPSTSPESVPAGPTIIQRPS
jgi:uncharacterized integral membrane protein (TIGR00698 family)